MNTLTANSSHSLLLKHNWADPAIFFSYSTNAYFFFFFNYFLQSSNRSLLIKLPVCKVNGTYWGPALCCSSSCQVHLVCNMLSPHKALLRALTPSEGVPKLTAKIQEMVPFVIITSDSMFPTCEAISWKSILCPQQILI